MTEDRKQQLFTCSLILGICILIFFMVRRCNENPFEKQVSSTQTAIIDTAKTVKRDGTGVTFQQATATITPKEIIREKLIFTDTASKRYIKEVARLKGVVAASQIKLHLRDSLVEVLAEENAYYQWSMYDTTGNFQYSLQLHKDSLMLDSIKMKMKYSYHFAVTSNTVKKRNTYTTTFRVDDPNVTLDNSIFVFVPQKTKPGIKFLKWFGIMGMNGLSFTGGYYLGRKTK